MAETPEPTTVDFKMPSLGSDMESGTVIGWHVAEGDDVAKGDVLLDVDTDKSDIEVEVWQDARIERILVGPGETVAVGTPIARLAIGAAPAAASSGGPAPRTPEPSEGPDLASSVAAREAPTEPSGRRPETSADAGPPIRHDGDSASLVTPRTVYWPTAVPVAATTTRRGPTTPAGGEDRPTRRQNVVALAMEQSNREIPHFHLTAELDLEATMAWLEATNDERPPPDRILPAAVLLRAVAMTVARHPTFNGTWVDGGFVRADTIRLGVAIHVRDGTLMTPVLPEADRLRLDEVMAAFRALVGRVRSGGLKSSDIALPTVTVTNLGDAGADTVAGVIRPPQVALVGFGRIRPRAIVVDGAVEPRRTVLATLSADHRANNGQAAAAFLTTLAEVLRSPEEL